MMLIIPLEEIEKSYQPYFKWGGIKNLSIDYATNSIHGYLNGEEIIVFNFGNFGIYLDNRRNSHQVSGGESGILISTGKNL